jgi:hypothetical protein
MKKIVVVAVFLFAVAVTGIFGQTDVGLLNTRKYSEYFGFRDGVIKPDDQNYIWQAPRADRMLFRELGNSPSDIDTPLEFALLSYYSQPVIKIRPVQADAILPAGNPSLANKKLGEALLRDKKILAFLGDTEAAERHDRELNRITARGDVSRAEIEAFQRSGMRKLISDIVDEEFSKPSTNGVDPVAVYADWQRRGLVRDSSGRAVNGIDLIKTTLTDFFLDPNQETYVRLRGMRAEIFLRGGSSGDPLYDAVNVVWGRIIVALSSELTDRIRSEFTSTRVAADFAAQVTDPTFRIFRITYGVGGGK